MDWTEAPALRRKLPANGHSPESTATAPVADSTRFLTIQPLFVVEKGPKPDNLRTRTGM